MAEKDAVEFTVQPELVWEHFTIRDGLPDMKIECIYEDSQGLIWVGTHEGGLACYDGYKFITYNTEDGLAGNGVFSAIEDDSGCMWFGTNRGLNRFDGTGFETIDLGGESRSFLWGRCKDLKGRLWFGLEREPGRDPAICCWDGDVLEEVVLAELDEQMEDLGESINAMDVDNKGRIWCGGRELYICDTEMRKKSKKRSIVKVNKAYKDNISSIVCRKNRVWIGCYGGIVHMYGDEIEYINVEEEINFLMYANNPERCYALSGNGGLWSVSFNQKSKLISQKNGIFWKGCIGLDGNVVWIGTYGMGFYKLYLDKISTYKNFNRTGIIIERSENVLFFCCRNRIVSFDTEKGIQTIISLSISKKLLSYSNALSDGHLYHGNADHIFGGSGQDLEIFGQSTKSAQPG